MGKLKYDAVRIAKQLCYKPEIIARIQNAKNRKRNLQNTKNCKGGIIK